MGGGGGGEIQQTPEELELSRIGRERWKDYKTRFIPERAELIEEIESWAEPEYRREMMGEAQGMITRQLPMGAPVDPRGGGSFADMLRRGTGRSAAMALGTAEADQMAEDKYLAGVQRLIGLGRGVSDTATAGMLRRAGPATSRAISEAESEAYADRSRAAGIGNLAGMALGAGYNAYQSGWFNPGAPVSTIPNPTPNPVNIPALQQSGPF